MHTLGPQTSGIGNHATSATFVRATESTVAHGLSVDPYQDWAIRFERGLNAAAERIRGWMRDPASLASDDLIAPSPEATSRAFEVIDELKKQVMDRVAPRSEALLEFRGVAPGPDGEIDVELASNDMAVTYRIEPDGGVFALFFRDNRLVDQKRLIG